LKDLPLLRGNDFMPEDKSFLIAQEWMAKGDNDLKNAAHTLKLGDKCPIDTVCFHAQQCVEKYLKAFLVIIKKEFPRTHDIEMLISLMPKSIDFSLSVEEQRKFTEYATVMRYPGPYEPISLNEAKKAVKLARQIKRTIHKLIENKGLF